MKTVILDVDTGVDDAFAIMFAARHPDLNLIGITCVDGNTKLSQVLINTLKVLDKAGARHIPQVQVGHCSKHQSMPNMFMAAMD